jgi:DNA-binding transcriptional LysR family regulator
MFPMDVVHSLHEWCASWRDRLNLLVALDALLAERSVRRAAFRIGITQSAASHALARLRKLTGDELLVRGRGGMVPTVRAEVMGAPLRAR